MILQQLPKGVRDALKANYDVSESDEEDDKEWTPEEFYEQGIVHYKANRFMEAWPLIYTAAQRGYVPAQYQLAVMYINGEGAELSYHYGLQWCQIAAGNGSMRARNWLRKLESVKPCSSGSESV